jgi:mRNA interferase MazF
MPIQEHPLCGTILVCDFSGLKEPEMVKRRPVIVVSPKITARPGLCTVVALSTVQPAKIMPYHVQLSLSLPPPGARGSRQD